MLWLNSSPKVKVCRLLGRVTSSKLCLKWNPNVKLCNAGGKFTCSKLLLNLYPRLRCLRSPGKSTPSKAWVKQKPKLRAWRLLGSCTRSRLWLKQSPKVKVSRSGKVTCGDGKIQTCWTSRSPRDAQTGALLKWPPLTQMIGNRKPVDSHFDLIIPAPLDLGLRQPAPAQLAEFCWKQVDLPQFWHQLQKPIGSGVLV